MRGDRIGVRNRTRKTRGTKVLYTGGLWKLSIVGILIAGCSGLSERMGSAAIATQRDPFAQDATDFAEWVPADMVTDALRPTDAEIYAVERWTHAAFTGQELPISPDQFLMTVRRQDHGTFGVGRSCIGTAPLKIGSQIFVNGLGTHANSEILVQFPEPVVRFTAKIGIDNNTNTHGVSGSVRFILEDPTRTESAVLYQSEILQGKDEPVAIDVAFPQPMRSLLLKVDMTEDGPSCDQADWCEGVAVTATGQELPLTDAGTSLSTLDVSLPFSFVYGGVSSRELLPKWNFSTETIAEGENAGRTAYRWTDPESGLVVTAIARRFARFAAVDWVLYFHNTGTTRTPVIENVRALDVNGTVDAATIPSVLHTLIGDRCNEESWLPIRERIEPGSVKTYTPVGGRPSNGAFPFWNLQRAPSEDSQRSEGVFVAIGWSGQWTATFERPKGQPTDRVHISAGMEKIHTVLEPGEQIRSPRILLMPWSCDRASAHALFRRLLMYEYAPKMSDGRPQRLRFIGQCFDRYYRKLAGWEKIDGQLAYADKLAEAGCDTHWFDAAWFPKGFPTGVGNWFADQENFPDGLRPLADRIHELAMKFVLWFEPERVAPDTWLAKEYPQYVAHVGEEKDGIWPGDGLYRLDDPSARVFLSNHVFGFL